SERQLPICSKRRPEAIAKTVNQIAKTQKLPAKHINQGFFDPSNLLHKSGDFRDFLSLFRIHNKKDI
ncbi:hypothetical protein, partial [Gluconobacter japonicus]|uniref:hypothetical protein n=1 Tax=Gluconobacter japonicus TaxID=376620 RepID=UPI0024E11CB1